MHIKQSLLPTCSFSAFHITFVSPRALLQGTGGGADSCPTDPVTVDTWKKLDVDKLLKDWSAANVTLHNQIIFRHLVIPFGAPNFFCTGQPRLLVGLHACDAFCHCSWAGPLAGPLSTAATAISGGTNFVVSLVKPPTRADLFVQWSDISKTLVTVLSDFQGTVSSFSKATLDTPVDQVNTGAGQNFSQAGLQPQLTKTTGGDLPNELCSGGCSHLMIQGDSNDNANNRRDVVDLLISKYGLTKEQVLVGPAACLDANGGKTVD
ncbi:hypothetical protein B0O99DRAFT_703435 [Bisporella sp. PMI_857]|nr:hypothetical protein B0O99DRAFT_703435 [Bisporella sp. PMI_857]